MKKRKKQNLLKFQLDEKKEDKKQEVLRNVSMVLAIVYYTIKIIKELL